MTSIRELKKFAFWVGGAFIFLAALAEWRGRPTVALIFSAAGALLLIFGTFAPRLLRPVYKVWMAAGAAIGKVTTGIILIVVFFLFNTPFAVLSRLLGKNFLGMWYNSEKDSYWTYRERAAGKPEEYEHQF